MTGNEGERQEKFRFLVVTFRLKNRRAEFPGNQKQPSGTALLTP
jgi:hypothetical protein